MIHKPLISPLELKQIFPLQSSQKAFIEKSRSDIRQILEAKDSRLLLIMGPCSLHDAQAAKEYAIKLKQLANEVSDQFLLVMRAYFEKPRTVLGWKGLLHDPELDNSNDIEKGLKVTRQLLLELTEIEIPLASEFLEPASCAYLDDLVSWGCIGARTSASQTHRQMASGLPMPIGFKNTIDGNVKTAVQGIVSCRQAHTYLGINQKGYISSFQTNGNGDGHLVLRGSESGTNYDPESIANALKNLKLANLPLQLLVDCSHGNSNRNFEQQCVVFQSLIGQVIEGNPFIRGMLLESHLNAGNQQMTRLSDLQYAVSLTDPCLDWSTTENLVQWAYRKIKQENSLKNSSKNAILSDDFAFQRIC
ncbi:MAG: 3-deoxy-7-phosphoheptulonate synthase [Parachlamydiaceae bacterium]|nr:MAG: 3-deoxy-7-phosphoheptulonate synthase [Parachlamydiaceae bacterium]